jgi:hypothetical protein
MFKGKKIFYILICLLVLILILFLFRNTIVYTYFTDDNDYLEIIGESDIEIKKEVNLYYNSNENIWNFTTSSEQDLVKFVNILDIQKKNYLSYFAWINDFSSKRKFEEDIIEKRNYFLDNYEQKMGEYDSLKRLLEFEINHSIGVYFSNEIFYNIEKDEVMQPILNINKINNHPSVEPISKIDKDGKPVVEVTNND